MKRAVITVVINKQREILLLKRPDNHRFPNQWCFPGGKIDHILENPSGWAGSVQRWETPEEAAIRETLEETGIQIRMLTRSNFVVADDTFVVDVFMAKIDDYQVTKEFPNREHVEYKWFKPDWNLENAGIPEGAGPMTTNVWDAVCSDLY